MFQKFEDYDPYSFYAANRLFFALRKNLQNQGKTVKGKVIRPIKSCLNYTKALLYPMKIEYQREAYREIIDEEFVTKKFDAFSFKQKMQEEARSTQLSETWFPEYVKESFTNISALVEKILAKSPFMQNSTEYKRLKLSILSSCIANLKQKNKLDADSAIIVTWKLPKSMASYIKILLKELYSEIKKEIMDCYNVTHMDDETVDQIINYREGADYDFNNNN